jgi:2',3'-cyclic-nucleotide 2'-phosphodiesterase (5'-nucleotidase family)
MKVYLNLSPKEYSMKFFKSMTFALALLAVGPALSEVIQILHTNDLHSYFQGTRGGMGGYAQLKVVVDSLKAEALAKGIPTIYLDGGDFGEGSSFYFSNQGVDSLRALDMLGVDVTVLGNHDFILGGTELRDQLRKAELKATILSANVKGKGRMGLANLMPSYKDFKFGDKKLRVFGLTTSEIHYQYPLRPLGYITSPHTAGIKMATKANRDRVDFTIALTHIGLEHDIRLVQRTRTIDLVVGGHSHIRLGKPELVKNLRGRLIPILQAGAHAGHIGAMIVDLKGKGEAELIDYRMIDITKDMPQDEDMKDFVETAYQNREAYFGRSWNEVIGHSDITLSGNFNGQDTQMRTCWSRHIARLTRKVANTDLGLQFDVFQGEQINAGPITFGDVVDNFPHFRRWGDQGWNVARARVSGFLLKSILNALANSEVAVQVTIDGVQSKDKSGRVVPYDPTVHTARTALIEGEELHNLRFYTVGLPSEVPYGIMKFLGIFGRLLLMNLDYLEDQSYWPLLENYVAENSPLQCLQD